MITPPDPATLSILLLTVSPLLRAELEALLGRRAEGGISIRLHVSEARERELANVMPIVAPRVVLVPFDPGDGRTLDSARELRLIEQLVRGWRVPILVLGLRQDRDATIETAVATACRAAGAIGYLPRDSWIGNGAGLRAKIGAAARVKVLRPLGTSAVSEVSPPAPRSVGPLRESRRRLHDGPGSIVVVGASAGGPEALREFLSALPVALPAPVLIVQHLPPAFGLQLAADLSRFTPFGVSIAAVGDALLSGRALLVPGRQALTVADGTVTGVVEAAIGGVHGQAIDRTMESVAAAYGAGAIGVILSGMGEDGVRGLRSIKARGGLAFGQDEASCQVYGMPRRAAELGLLDRAGTPTELGAVVSQLLRLAASGAQVAELPGREDARV